MEREREEERERQGDRESHPGDVLFKPPAILQFYNPTTLGLYTTNYSGITFCLV
jgi:hypothetical protein